MKTRPVGGGGSVDTAVLSIHPGRVRPFADQPREYFDAGELISLELSIKQRGQLQPAMVRRLAGDRDHDYEIVDGQRRWHACMRLNVPFRAVIIDPENPEDQFEIAVAANFQRSDHTPMEIAKAIERMCTQGKRTEEYVSTLFGKSTWWVSAHRSLNNLVLEIQQLLEPRASKDQLAVAMAIQIARLPKEQQLSTLEDIQARGLTVARAIDKIRLMLVGDAPERRKKPDQHHRNLENFVRATIQKADMTLDRMGPDDFRLMVAMLTKNKAFDRLRESVMTAIGRLEVLHRRLSECRAGVGSEPAPAQKPEAAPAPDPAPLRAHASAVAYLFSHPMKCPKCGTTGARFRRRSAADLQKDYWICETKGCQLKISHYNIRVDKTYQPKTAGVEA